MLQFLLSEDFIRSLGKLDGEIQKEIKRKVRFFSETENPLLFAKKLKGYKDVFRFRSGNYRIIFRVEKNTIILVLVKHRKDVYEGL